MQKKYRIVEATFDQEFSSSFHQQRVSVVNGVSKLKSKDGIGLAKEVYLEIPNKLLFCVLSYHESVVGVRWVLDEIDRDHRSIELSRRLRDRHPPTNRHCRKSATRRIWTCREQRHERRVLCYFDMRMIGIRRAKHSSTPLFFTMFVEFRLFQHRNEVPVIAQGNLRRCLQTFFIFRCTW